VQRTRISDLMLCWEKTFFRVVEMSDILQLVLIVWREKSII